MRRIQHLFYRAGRGHAKVKREIGMKRTKLHKREVRQQFNAYF